MTIEEVGPELQHTLMFAEHGKPFADAIETLCVKLNGIKQIAGINIYMYDEPDLKLHVRQIQVWFRD